MSLKTLVSIDKIFLTEFKQLSEKKYKLNSTLPQGLFGDYK